MLRELRLRNLAIAEDVVLELGPGLNVLSGSTGAGKSLVVEALRWLRGEKTDPGLIRSGAEAASAEALLDLGGRSDLLTAVADLGLDAPSDGLLHLRRELRRGGRSRAFIDGAVTSAAHLSALCDRLLQLQSQHQQTRLSSPAHHRRLLDECGVPGSLQEAWEETFETWRRCRDAVDRWRRRRDELAAQRELLSYQFRELEDAGLEAGEMEALRERVAVRVGGARLLEQAQKARDLLDEEEGGALGRLARAEGLLERGEAVADLREARELLVEALELAGEAARGLERFVDAADFDVASLDRDQARLARLEELCRKYGRTEVELIAQRDRLAVDLDEEEWGEKVPSRLTGPLERAEADLVAAGTALLRARRRVAHRAGEEAARLLAGLGMPEAEVVFAVEPRRDPEGPVRVAGQRVQPQREGCETVRLLVRTNRGEALGPLERVASGGELSRIGLVLRTLAVEGAQPALVILDEVDAGVGADLGPALARRLSAMGDRLQLLVITHLPAVAAAAARHLVAEKDARGDRTVSRIFAVEGDARVEELGRMLGGARETSRRLARELLAQTADRREEEAGA